MKALVLILGLIGITAAVILVVVLAEINAERYYQRELKKMRDRDKRKDGEL